MRRLSFIAILGLILVVSVGCASIRQGVSWPNTTLVAADDGQSLYVAYKGSIVQVNTETGRLVQLRNTEGEVRTDADGNPRRWELRGDGNEFFTAPIWTGDEDSFLIADYNNRLLEVNDLLGELDGGVKAELPGHVIATPVFENNILVVPFNEQDVAAYDLETFEQLWLFETERGIWSSPLIMDGIVYIGAMDQHLYALDLETGAEEWSLEIDGAIAASPLHEDGNFYLGTFTGKVLKISIAERDVVAEYDTENWVWSTPVLYEDVLYVTDLSGYVYALDRDLNEVAKTRASTRGIRPSPLVTDQYIIVGDRGGRVHWLERSTMTLLEDFSQDAGGEILSELILVERSGDLDPIVVVSTVNEGRLLRSYTLESVPGWVYPQ